MNKFLEDLKKTLETKSCPQCKGEILKYRGNKLLGTKKIEIIL